MFGPVHVLISWMLSGEIYPCISTATTSNGVMFQNLTIGIMVAIGSVQTCLLQHVYYCYANMFTHERKH